jgi:hypothetical protein
MIKAVAVNKSIPDPEDMLWYQYSASRKRTLESKNQRHELVLEPGEMVGLKQSTRGTSAGNYLVMLGSKRHVIFRNVDFRAIKNMISRNVLVPARFDGRKQNTEGRNAHHRSRTSAPNKLKDMRYNPRVAAEKSYYDRANYQWRKVKAPKPIHITARKSTKTKGNIRNNDVIGVRFKNNTIGGYLILPNGARVNISAELYDEIVQSSTVLPSSRQMKGEVSLKEANLNLPKSTRTPRVKIPKVEPREDIDMIKRIKDYKNEVVDDWDDEDEFEEDTVQDTEVDTDVEDDGVEMEEDDMDEDAEPEEDDMDEDAEPEEDDMDEDDEPEEDDMDEDAEPEEDARPSNPQPERIPRMATTPKSHLPASVIKRGNFITSGLQQGTPYYIVVSEKDMGSFMEYHVYNTDTQDIRKLRIPSNTDMAGYKDIRVGGRAEPEAIREAFKAYRDSVNNNQFSDKTIHEV